jgi:hypothetical protein
MYIFLLSQLALIAQMVDSDQWNGHEWTFGGYIHV